MAFTVTKNIAVLTSQALAAGASVSTGTLDYTGDDFVYIMVDALAGAAVAATNGCQIDIYNVQNGVVSTIDNTGSTLAMTANIHSTTPNITLGPGQYVIKLTNLDATNGITVQIIGESYSG